MICPKCHLPLEGEEQYICCAGATLQWRCRACAKVSDGFAFPYGGCPHCGGKLEPLAVQQLEDKNALEAVRAAFEWAAEPSTAARQRRRTSHGYGMFSSLAGMEEEHMETLAHRYHAQAPARSATLRSRGRGLFRRN